MAEQVRVPGAELEELGALLSRVAQFVDDETKVNVLDEAVGPPLQEPAQNFEDRWTDGRYQLRKQCEELAEIIKTILDTFADTDNKVAAPLSEQTR
jgi:hypothetical protein